MIFVTQQQQKTYNFISEAAHLYLFTGYNVNVIYENI